MKLVLKGKKQKGLKVYGFRLLASLGIVFALSSISFPLAFAGGVVLFTGSLL